MPIHLLGTSAGDAPFNRSFFNTTLGELVGGNGRNSSHRVSLFLVDGTTLDVCSIESLTDQYATVTVYGSDDSCTMSLHLVPYGTIYRIEISPSEEEKGQRVGFHWTREPKIEVRKSKSRS